MLSAPLEADHLAHRPHRVNIWRDPNDTTTIRQAGDGGGAVPTVAVTDRARTDPAPERARERLSPSPRSGVAYGGPGGAGTRRHASD
ncbi:hypothetical protein [Streptomyces sp. NPDC002559]